MKAVFRWFRHLTRPGRGVVRHLSRRPPLIITSVDLPGALLVSTKGKRIRLCIRSYWHSLTGKEVIAFLQQILDRCLFHCHGLGSPSNSQAQDGEEFLAKHKRLHVFYFPVAAPELNPAELVWNQATEYTAGTAPHNGKELQTNVFNAVAQTRSSQKRLQACLLGTRIKWFN